MPGRTSSIGGKTRSARSSTLALPRDEVQQRRRHDLRLLLWAEVVEVIEVDQLAGRELLDDLDLEARAPGGLSCCAAPDAHRAAQLMQPLEGEQRDPVDRDL